MVVIAMITNVDVLEKILNHSGEPQKAGEMSYAQKCITKFASCIRLFTPSNRQRLHTAEPSLDPSQDLGSGLGLSVESYYAEITSALFSYMMGRDLSDLAVLGMMPRIQVRNLFPRHVRNWSQS